MRPEDILAGIILSTATIGIITIMHILYKWS